MPKLLKTGFSILLGAVLTWLVITHSLVAYLAKSAPDVAYWINPSHPDVLAELSERGQNARQAALAASPPRQPTADKTVIRDQALAALGAQPLSPRLLRVLGQLEDEGGRPERALELMEAAERLSRHEPQALLWLLKHSYEERDWKRIVARSDVLLRTRTQVHPIVIPALARVAEDPAGRDELMRVLATDPPWRPSFFNHLPSNVAEWRTPLNVLDGLKSTAAPPTAKDYLPYINFLVGRQRVDLAYYAWLQSLPPERLTEVGLLYNGTFKFPLTNMPFDWVIHSGAGSTVEVQTLGPIKALAVAFSIGRVNFGGVSQLTVLSPGSYVLTGKLRGDLNGRRGLEWQIACTAPSAKVLGQSPMFVGNSRDWRDFDVKFDVPREGCPAQTVRLVLAARSASEQLVSGTVHYQALSITPDRAANNPQ